MPELDFGLQPMTITPLKYQAEGFMAAVRDFESGLRSVNSVLVTGSGKTILAGLVARWVIEEHDGRVLFLAHREELLNGCADDFARVGVDVLIERAGENAKWGLWDPKCVAASVHTLKGARLRSWPRDHFTLIITDGCFPAGTMIDGRPIESIRLGDWITSFSEKAWLPVKRPVVRVFRRKPSGLVRIHLSTGESIVCTPDHPVFTYTENLAPCYVPAKDLTTYNMVYGITPLQKGIHHGDQAQDVRRLRHGLSTEKLEPDHDADVFADLQGEASGRSGQDREPAVRGMREGSRLQREERVGTGEAWTSVLLLGMSGYVHLPAFIGTDGRDESRACVGSDETEQSHARSGGERKAADDAPGDGVAAACEGWEWQGADRPSTAPGVRTRMADGARHSYGDAENQCSTSPVALQDRHCESHPEGGDRGGRRDALVACGDREGSEKGCLSPVARVVRVEVLQPSCDGQFGGLCPDGHVYNLEVEGNHNYFADGFLVHNCHHATAASYGNIYEWFDWRWHFGISAGIDRLDGESLGTVFQIVSYEYPYDRAVADGSICRAEFARVHTSADLSAIRTTGRDDLGPKQIEAAIGPHIAEMSKVAAAKLGHRRTLGFAPCVGSAVAFASAFNSEAIGITAAAIHADTQDRAAVWDDFRHGKVRVVWNYMVATEGINLPFVSGAILARATKSRNLYSQMVGRTLRNFPGKQSSLIVDFHWLSGEHELAGPTSLVDATNFDHGVLPLAEAFIADGRESDLMRAIERAKTVHRKRADYRVKVDDRKARFCCEMFDPLAAMEVMGVPLRRSGDVSNANLPTPRQAELLARMGVDGAERLSRHRASRLLDVLLGRARQKLGTYRQVRKLQELGVDPAVARALTKAEASARLDELLGRRAG